MGKEIHIAKYEQGIRSLQILILSIIS